MDKKNNIDFVGGSILIILSVLLGLNQSLIKICNQGIHPILQIGLRSFLAIIPVMIYIFIYKKKITIRDGSLFPGIICGIIFGIEFIFMFYSLELTSVARASIFFYSMPVWVTIAAHFLIPDEKISIIKMLGLFCSIFAIFIALFSKNNIENGSLIGDLLALLGSVLWATIVMLVRTTSLKKASPEMQLLYQLVISSLIILPLSMLFENLIRDINYIIILIFLFQAFCIVAGCFLAWFWLLSIYPASIMTSYSFLSPVFGVIFGWVLLGEEINFSIFISLLLVSLGIFLINRKVHI